MEGEGLNGTPPNISLSNRDSGPGFLGTPYKPFAPNGKGKQDLTLNGVTTDRLGDRRQLLASFDQFRRDDMGSFTRFTATLTVQHQLKSRSTSLSI